MSCRLIAIAGVALVGLAYALPAQALTMQECSAKYNAAKEANLVDGMSWNDFRRAECGPDASTSLNSLRAKASRAAGSDTGKGLTMAECSARYQAAKAAGSLRGATWNEFRRSQCGSGANDDDTVPSIDEARYSGEPERPTTTAPRGVRFPNSVSRKYSGETPGKARLHTCLDAYYANKDAGTLGGLRWVQRGGGYYSLCNARLQG